MQWTLREKVEYCVKAALGSLCIYNLTEKPIFIFSTRRSGSTLLMEMVYSQPNVDYINQPLTLWNYHPHLNKIFRPNRNRFISLDSEIENKKLLMYFQDLLSGKLRLHHEWNIFDSRFSWHVNRLVVKELNAKCFIDWFSKNFDVEVIFLLRHPIPTALSIIRRKWGNTARAFLENDYFLGAYLNKKRKIFCQNILDKGTPLQKFVLEWCLDNMHPLERYKQRPWLTLTYEELVLRVKKASQLICQKFDLPDWRAMENCILKPSRTSTKVSKKKIKKQGPSSLLQDWRQVLQSKDIEHVSQILEEFEIKEYSAHHPYPHDSLCHFGPLSSNHRGSTDIE